MVDLVLWPSDVYPQKPYALRLRWHESVGETEYHTLCYVTKDIAQEIIRAGGASWMFREPED